MQRQGRWSSANGDTIEFVIVNAGDVNTMLRETDDMCVFAGNTTVSTTINERTARVMMIMFGDMTGGFQHVDLAFRLRVMMRTRMAVMMRMTCMHMTFITQ